MITFSDERTKPEGGVYPSSRVITMAKALDILINCELAFGGKIVVIEPTRVQTRTVVMGCVDISTFEGSVEEMQYLVKVASNTQFIRDLRNDPERGKDDGTYRDIRRLESAIGSGTNTAKLGVIATLGVTCETQAGKLATTGLLKDLVAAVSLIAEGQATPEEALALI